MIDAIDHLVLTVLDVEASLVFYARVLGMTPKRVGEGRGASISAARRSTFSSCTRASIPIRGTRRAAPATSAC